MSSNRITNISVAFPESRSCSGPSISICLTKKFIHCHTQLHLGFSAKLRIWQVSACKMEPQSGTIITDWTSQPASQPCTYFDSLNVVRCPHPNCSTHEQSMCGVPPSQYMHFPTRIVLPIEKVCAVSPLSSLCAFCAVSPPPNVVMCLCHTLLCLGF